MNAIGEGWLLWLVLGSIFSLFSFVGLGVFLSVEGYWMSKGEIFRILGIWGGLTSVLLACTLIFSIRGINKDLNKEWNNKIYDIVSLERGNETEGNFTLGSGTIEEKSYYYFYTIRDYGYKLEKLETEYTYIKQTDEISPSVYSYKKKGANKSYYFIYCPSGTIVETYRG